MLISMSVVVMNCRFSLINQVSGEGYVTIQA